MRERVKKKQTSATVGDLCDAMNAIAPLLAAASWDNVGLLVGSRRWPVKSILLVIDTTQDVLEEADAGRFDAIVSYHPVLFKGTKQLVIDSRSQEGVAADCLSRRIAVYSPHTALDAAPGGTNDVLSELAGLVDLKPLIDSTATAQCKLVVFVPETHVEKVADAVFAAGAGRIGAYEKCSFRLNGQGTFFGTDETNPVVGRKGRLERVDEVRMETVMPGDAASIREVTAAVRAVHPYEEPAFEFYSLTAMPSLTNGQGRIGRFKSPVRIGALAQTLKKATRATCASIVGDPKSGVTRGIVCVGSAGDLPFGVAGGLRQGDVIITGEMRHHDALRVQRCGAAAILLGHWTSERPVLKSLARTLQSRMPGCTIKLSKADADPIRGV